ncbi:hypothetical protein [Kibdelosporangium philippinense]|uniref:hypothetical protein n=1 Tax=Kibdelosporangium philippinense TaxID=211113 RepID=UPI003621F3CD
MVDTRRLAGEGRRPEMQRPKRKPPRWKAENRKQRSTRCAAKVDTVCWNGGHGLQERWTRCAGTVDTRGGEGGVG